MYLQDWFRFCICEKFEDSYHDSYFFHGRHIRQRNCLIIYKISEIHTKVKLQVAFKN